MLQTRILNTLLGVLSVALANSAFASTAELLLARDLKPAVQELKHETRFYHYFRLPIGAHPLEDTTLQFAEKRTEYVNRRIQFGGGAFWDLSRTSTSLTNAGPGLYLATDPYVSSPDAAATSGANFGETMLELTFKAGTPYLDVKSKPPLLKKDTLAALSQEALLSADQARALLKDNRLTRETLRYMVLPQHLEFRKLIQRIFKSERIELVEYAWQSATPALCQGKSLRSAFVYVGPGSEEISANVLTNTLVYWPGFSEKIILTDEELKSLEQNKKLHALLKTLVVEQKKLETTKGTASRKSLQNKINALVSEAYSDLGELHELRQRIFKCL